jgi:ABC-type sugar transport system permease subunit
MRATGPGVVDRSRTPVDETSTGFGAAIAVVRFVVVALFTLLRLRLSRRPA